MKLLPTSIATASSSTRRSAPSEYKRANSYGTSSLKEESRATHRKFGKSSTCSRCRRFDIFGDIYERFYSYRQLDSVGPRSAEVCRTAASFP
jgi:hypothetical protein